MEKIETYINPKTILEYLEETEEISASQYQNFVEYLEVDFHEWLKSNLHTFLMNQDTSETQNQDR